VLPNPPSGFAHLTRDNLALLDLIHKRERLYLDDPVKLFPPLLWPCRVRVLLVADGGLDFSLADFGLRTFVETLLIPPGPYVRFEVSVAHISPSVSDDAVMLGHAGIARSIKGFRFDDPSHFTPSTYQQVWLFGISTFYSRGAGYPSNRLSDAELRALSEFMNAGGGLFATGDHGALGVCLSGSIPRARSMRLWGSTSTNNAIDEVSMDGPRRNDTNRLGQDVVSSFDDQSDDVPQDIQPKLYRRRWGLWESRFPHPLLCGPRGVIRAMPDHPHEGQCVEPANTGLSSTFAGYTIKEYPSGVGGGPQPLPELIAWSSVLSGSTGGSKQSTDPHTFGSICAYDGHRAGVGRVTTDATWHHFVNINLVGVTGLPATNPKQYGFLYSTAGQAYLEDIKAYYRNLAVWLSPQSALACIRLRICWWLLWQHRILEATLFDPVITLRRATFPLLYAIGRHARDVLGRYAGQCESYRLLLDLVTPHVPRAVFEILDPWLPPRRRGPIPEPDPVPWFDPEPLLSAALGGALVGLREAFPTSDAVTLEKAEAMAPEVIELGAKAGVDGARQSLSASSQRFTSIFGQTKPPTPRGKAKPRRRSR
jgi:hypothetical protein